MRMIGGDLNSLSLTAAMDCLKKLQQVCMYVAVCVYISSVNLQRGLYDYMHVFVDAFVDLLVSSVICLQHVTYAWHTGCMYS